VNALIDLFCCAGGAAMGYHRAGFEVFGVDKEPQPRYPFWFHQGDALNVLDTLLSGYPVLFRHPDGREREMLIGDFVAAHASPPCQLFTAYRRKGHGVGDGYLNLIPETRGMLEMTLLPWIIENVEQAKSELRDPVRVCGSSFELDVRRHRLFESNVPLTVPPCDHSWQTPRFTPASNRTNLRRTVEVGVWRIPLDVQRKAMGIEWMELRELSEAIPPAYTEWLGRQLLDQGTFDYDNAFASCGGCKRVFWTIDVSARSGLCVECIAAQDQRQEKP
jgi:DNA (cytosine-5)-methyltransferase 1